MNLILLSIVLYIIFIFICLPYIAYHLLWHKDIFYDYLVRIYGDVDKSPLDKILFSWAIPLYHRISHVVFKTKMLLQIITKGYSDEQVWNLDEHAAEWILKRLKVYRSWDKTGVPYPIAKKYQHAEIDKAAEEWNHILDDIIYALQKIAEGEYDPTDERCLLGYKYFGEYFIYFSD